MDKDFEELSEKYKDQTVCREKFEKQLIDLYVDAYKGKFESYDEFVTEYKLLDCRYEDEMYVLFGVLPTSLNPYFESSVQRAEESGESLKDYAYFYLDCFTSLTTPDFEVTSSGNIVFTDISE